MELVNGIIYNFRGLGMGARHPQLLLLGLLRFFFVIVITIGAASLILIYHNEILDLVWTRPESRWILWLWVLLSWVLAVALVGLSAVMAYLASQILFGVVIMDRMSRITEANVTGQVKEPVRLPFFRLFFHLIRQEIPRAILPVIGSLVLMILGWFLPVGLLVAVLTSCATVIFLAWDNTDLTPARRLYTYRDRFRFLSRTLWFHLGFGLPFLIPGLNILLLAFAPVGATLYYLEKHNEGKSDGER
jgi:CysZ protein